MKVQYLFLIAALIMFQSSLFSQEKEDNLKFKFNNFKIYQEAITNHYYIKNSLGAKVYHNLLFTKYVEGFLQVLDDKGHIFYLDESGKKTETIHAFHGYCGTVPHYVLSIREDKDSFYVYEDETFYDGGNKIPAEKKAAIAKSRADELFFINSGKEYSFTSNYGLDVVCIENPRNVFFRKGNQFGFWGDTAQFDKIEQVGNMLRAEKDGLYCYPKIAKIAKYKSLAAFDNHLAAFELPNGKKGFLDTDGKEYFVN